MPAAIGGPGQSIFQAGQGWVATGAGGRLFLADGLFDLSYGPEDLVILNGNCAHGVERLCALRHPGVHHPKGTTELQRFSAIMFSTFAREDRLWKPGNYDEAWQEGWRAKVEWRKEHRPPERVLGKRRSLDP